MQCLRSSVCSPLVPPPMKRCQINMQKVLLWNSAPRSSSSFNGSIDLHVKCDKFFLGLPALATITLGCFISHCTAKKPSKNISVPYHYNFTCCCLSKERERSRSLLWILRRKKKTMCCSLTGGRTKAYSYVPSAVFCFLCAHSVNGQFALPSYTFFYSFIEFTAHFEPVLFQCLLTVFSIDTVTQVTSLRIQSRIQFNSISVLFYLFLIIFARLFPRVSLLFQMKMCEFCPFSPLFYFHVSPRLASIH